MVVCGWRTDGRWAVSLDEGFTLMLSVLRNNGRAVAYAVCWLATTVGLVSGDKVSPVSGTAPEERRWVLSSLE